MTTVWITKYALSEGIREAQVVQRDDDGYVFVSWPGGLNGQAGFNQNQYAATETEAAQEAELMRISKTQSLRAQIAKLEKLKITVHRLQEKEAT